MLGSGHPNLKERIKRAQEEHSDSESFHGVIRFSEALAHRYHQSFRYLAHAVPLLAVLHPFAFQLMCPQLCRW
jgi:hypothetical protein